MKQRVLTAALLIPPVLLAVFLSSFYFLWVLALAALIVGYQELRGLAGLKGKGVPILSLLLLLLALPGITFADSDRYYSFFVALGEWAAPAAGLACLVVGAVAATWIAAGRRGWIIAEVASLWLGAALFSMVLLKLPVQEKPLFEWTTPVLLCLVPLWIGDTLAIFAGKAFGKHLLAPKISPKKTVEGGIANLLGCIGGAIGLAALIHQPLIVGILVGVATGVLGQAGDLLESAMKRSAGVKDSGTLLPGHGGLLDRIDSILLSAPVVALIVVMLGGR